MRSSEKVRDMKPVWRVYILLSYFCTSMSAGFPVYTYIYGIVADCVFIYVFYDYFITNVYKIETNVSKSNDICKTISKYLT